MLFPLKQELNTSNWGNASDEMQQMQEDMFKKQSELFIAIITEHCGDKRGLIEKLKTVYDPEIPVDIYELGLIYKVDVSDTKDVVIDMTLTAPGCPVAGDMPGWVQEAVMTIPDIKSCNVNIVFEPPWDASLMSDEAKLELNMF